ncbi:sulfite exporter TauE/SafE family protein [Adhaeribacter swui]|uniref:Sulfite exporter TauE/SafE family protein n=1 Tax=Adhaeribacter swui TaxID=2086471 RepID=A0A7G7G912_9BACT|nr:sulfite exporter TauE/SafE family protein [Adhaeribacter swui]QNF33646.1 sulfite exporter TauE/SafE family protein [Adhaeribacter swui]
MIWAGFVFGILGSFHCVGMCGPIALALPVGRGTGWSYVAGRLLYNLGRITTYTLLGTLAGLIGKSLQIAVFQQTLSVVSGVLILLVLVLPLTIFAKFRGLTGLGKLLQYIKKSIGYFFGKNNIWSLGVVGLLNGLLPCGFVYFALAGALSMPTVPTAMGYMFLFGLGTFPLMLVISLTGKFMQPRIRHFFNRAVPYAASFLALLFILRGLNLGIPYVSPVLGQSQTTTAAAPAHCH